VTDTAASGCPTCGIRIPATCFCDRVACSSCGHDEDEHLSAAKAGMLRQGRSCRWRGDAGRCPCTGFTFGDPSA
jgi:hypothetical protein